MKNEGQAAVAYMAQGEAARPTLEQAAQAAPGGYAAVLLAFFQPYLFDFLPLVTLTYWATHQAAGELPFLAGFILLPAVAFSLAGAPQPDPTIRSDGRIS